MTTCSVSKECCYLKSLLIEIGFTQNIRVHIDSTAALSMVLNPVHRQKAKHFNVRYHWVRECHQLGRLKYYHLEGGKTASRYAYKGASPIFVTATSP